MRFTGMDRNLICQLFRMPKRRYNVPGTKYKVGIRIWTRILPLKDMLAFKKGTLYFVHFFRLDTSYLLLARRGG